MTIEAAQSYDIFRIWITISSEVTLSHCCKVWTFHISKSVKSVNVYQSFRQSGAIVQIDHYCGLKLQCFFMPCLFPRYANKDKANQMLENKSLPTTLILPSPHSLFNNNLLLLLGCLWHNNAQNTVLQASLNSILIDLAGEAKRALEFAD